MLKLIKSNLLILAMVFAMGTAVVAQTSNGSRAMKKYAFNPSAPAGSQWQDIDGEVQETPGNPGDYRCNLNDQVTCTAEFDSTINPNVGTHPLTNRIPGDYQPL